MTGKEALEYANEVRFRRAQLRADAKQAGRMEGRAMIADAIETMPSWLSGIDVVTLLEWTPRFSDQHVEEAMERLEVRSPRRPLRSLTQRQWFLLAEIIRQVGLKGCRAGESAARQRVQDRMGVAA